MANQQILERLRTSGLRLPKPSVPAGSYRAYFASGGFVFVSGQFPFASPGVLGYEGRVGSELTLQEGRDAARLAALNVLSHLRVATDDFDTLAFIVRVEGHVAACGAGVDVPAVLDGASEVFSSLLGACAGHARSAFAHRCLPLNAPVELVVTASTTAAGITGTTSDSPSQWQTTD